MKRFQIVKMPSPFPACEQEPLFDSREEGLSGLTLNVAVAFFFREIHLEPAGVDYQLVSSRKRCR